MASEIGDQKWHGNVSGIVEAPINKVWAMVSTTRRLSEWIPRVERCTSLSGEGGVPGYTRLLSGFMFPQQDGERSWIKEKLVSMDSTSHNYVYRTEASNVGLDGSVNSLRLKDYGEVTTFIEWSFEVDPLEGVSEDNVVDYLGLLCKSCINRSQGAIEAAPSKV